MRKTIYLTLIAALFVGSLVPNVVVAQTRAPEQLLPAPAIFTQPASNITTVAAVAPGYYAGQRYWAGGYYNNRYWGPGNYGYNAGPWGGAYVAPGYGVGVYGAPGPAYYRGWTSGPRNWNGGVNRIGPRR